MTADTMLSYNWSNKNGAMERKTINFIEQYRMLPLLRMLTSLFFYMSPI